MVRFRFLFLLDLEEELFHKRQSPFQT